jgi:hypothetical protein
MPPARPDNIIYYQLFAENPYPDVRADLIETFAGIG